MPLAIVCDQTRRSCRVRIRPHVQFIEKHLDGVAVIQHVEIAGLDQSALDSRLMPTLLLIAGDAEQKGREY